MGKIQTTRKTNFFIQILLLRTHFEIHRQRIAKRRRRTRECVTSPSVDIKSYCS